MSRVIARLFVLAVFLMSAFFAPSAMADRMGEQRSGGAAMIHNQSGGMKDCGAPAAVHCQLDCVLCHALAPAQPLGRVAAVAFVVRRPDAPSAWKARIVGVDPPVPRWSA